MENDFLFQHQKGLLGPDFVFWIQRATTCPPLKGALGEACSFICARIYLPSVIGLTPGVKVGADLLSFADSSRTAR